MRRRSHVRQPHRSAILFHYLVSPQRCDSTFSGRKLPLRRISQIVPWVGGTGPSIRCVFQIQRNEPKACTTRWYPKGAARLAALKIRTPVSKYEARFFEVVYGTSEAPIIRRRSTTRHSPPRVCGKFPSNAPPSMGAHFPNRSSGRNRALRSDAFFRMRRKFNPKAYDRWYIPKCVAQPCRTRFTAPFSNARHTVLRGGSQRERGCR